MFNKINEIKVSNKNTWCKNFFLTIDFDWANDEILLNSIKIIEKFDIKATWFVTTEA